MKIILEFPTKHEEEVLTIILSDPTFVLPFLFPVIKKVENENTKFKALGRFGITNFEMNGNVYRRYNGVEYIFTMTPKGSANLKFILDRNKVRIEFDYEGWLDSFTTLFIKRWFNIASKDFEERIRLRRIEKKI
ncbi:MULTISPECIES: DUF3211 domain-containing protein [Acidianus]|uniref:DUF3211 domain-containing protein n=1 Tax=Candidatus Acidianus copahuensis TaxID=1160895 RepID=A0A031LTB3_9CREN|nr:MULTISPECIES: DUF3211 domain-containing protein [Acidianus]EZQ11046.1 hypothetical protein CM19_02250 [Candidatus Acidianus copahuensis]